MFSHTTKRILPVLLVFGFIMITTPIRHYESFAGQSPELSVLTYCFGLVIGFAVILAAVMLDVRKPKNTEPVILKKSGIAILASLFIILAGLATGVAYFLINYLPEKIGFASLSYMGGLVIGFAAIAIMYYSPNYLPHEEPQT